MSNVRIISRLVTEQSQEHAKLIAIIRRNVSPSDPEYIRQDAICDGLQKAIEIASEEYDKQRQNEVAQG